MGQAGGRPSQNSALPRGWCSGVSMSAGEMAIIFIGMGRWRGDALAETKILNLGIIDLLSVSYSFFTSGIRKMPGRKFSRKSFDILRMGT